MKKLARRMIFVLLVSFQAWAADPLDSWTVVYSGQTNGLTFSSITYGDGQFAAVGDSGSVASSNNGLNWTHSPGRFPFVSHIAFGNGRFVSEHWHPLFGFAAIETSGDGVNWTDSWTESGLSLRNVTFGGGQFVAVGGDFTSNNISGLILTSSDGLNWVRRPIQAPKVEINAVQFGDGRFVAFGNVYKYDPDNDTTEYKGAILTSDDGVNWLQHSLDVFEGDSSYTYYIYFKATFGGGMFVATATFFKGNAILTSTDGVNWIRRYAEKSNDEIHDIAFGGGFFVITQGFGRILSSRDGISWSEHHAPSFLGGITFGDGHFVAVGENETILESGSITTPGVNVPVTKVVAWGDFDEAQKRMPPGLTNVLAIASGGVHIGGFVNWSQSSVLKQDGSIIEWAYDVGFWNGKTKVNLNVSDVVSMAVVSNELLVLASDGTLRSLQNSELQFSLTNAVAISGNRSAALVLKADGMVFEFNGDNTTNSAPSYLTNVVAVACGGNSFGGPFGLALKDDGTVAAWGANDVGQINVPLGLSNVIAIAAGYSHGMALKADESVVTWGVWASVHPTPPGLTNVVAIAAAGLIGSKTPEEIPGYSLALKADGTVVSWGNGTPGVGTTNVPPGLSNVVAIAAGPYRALALVADGPPVLHAPIMNTTWDTKGFGCSVSSECGRVYRLEYKDSFESKEWVALPLVAGNGRLLTLTDSSVTNQQRFYRVRRW